jgi:hypothetical protein
MFDLEQAIAEWRGQMLAAGIRAPVPLEELEIHLRDELEQQVKSGLNAQQAFEIAVQRIGQAHALKKEFLKVGGDVRVPFWLVMVAFSSFASFVAALFVPLFAAIAWIDVVTASVWELSPIITGVCMTVIPAIVFLPILRPGVKSWLLPFLFGLAVLVLAVCAFVYDSTTMAYKYDLFFHPYGLSFLAIGALLCVGEGLALRSRGHFLAKSVS